MTLNAIFTNLVEIKMMKLKILLLAIIIASCKTNLNTKSISLFNGKDLSGWTIYGAEKWYAEEGVLICENGADKKFGYLATDKKYKNFELSLEFKQNSKSNGGVFVRSTIEGIKIKGWQVEIGVPGHHTGGIHEYERGWLLKPDAINEKVLKMGEWNHMKVRLKGDHMIVWLNGVEMTNLVDEKLGEGEGSIALQVHKGSKNKLMWRNIKIINL